MTKQFKFWCKGTSSNLNFNKKGWWTFPDFILSKYYDGLSIFESEDFAACQWTGLTDSTGRKIFEGDIVVFTSTLYIGDPMPVFTTGEVRFSDNLCAFSLKTISEDRHNGTNIQMFGGQPERYKIIGNIFENPELLN